MNSAIASVYDNQLRTLYERLTKAYHSKFFRPKKPGKQKSSAVAAAKSKPKRKTSSDKKKKVKKK
jgi:hypothetical protein